MGETGLYLYGITDGRSEVSLGPVGVGEPAAEVRLILVGDMTAAVSPVADGKAAPRAGNLLAHDRVLTTLVQRHTVPPVAFGTVFPGEAELRACLDRFRGVLVAEPERMRGKVEAELKVLWVPEAVAQAAGYTPAQLQALGASNAACLYQIALEVGQAVEATVEAWRGRFVSEVCSHLAPLCLGYRLNKPLVQVRGSPAPVQLCGDQSALGEGQCEDGPRGRATPGRVPVVWSAESAQTGLGGPGGRGTR